MTARIGDSVVVRSLRADDALYVQLGPGKFVQIPDFRVLNGVKGVSTMDTTKTTITLSRSELADIGVALDLLAENMDGIDDEAQAAKRVRLERKIQRAIQRTWQREDA